jgi:hypothetical protein
MGTETPISTNLAKISNDFAKISNEDTVDKSSKNEVTEGKTAKDPATLKQIKVKTDAAMLEEIKNRTDAAMLTEIMDEIIGGKISTIERLEEFVKEIKIRHALQECRRTVLEQFFDMLANAEPPSGVFNKPSAVSPCLAKDVLKHMSNDKKITDFNTLEILLETLMDVEVHSEAFSWKPQTGEEQEALMQYITGDCARFWIGNSHGVSLAPGFWLMLKIRQELCAHVLSSDHFCC